jgi:hypothetical protein
VYGWYIPGGPALNSTSDVWVQDRCAVVQASRGRVASRRLLPRTKAPKAFAAQSHVTILPSRI